MSIIAFLISKIITWYIICLNIPQTNNSYKRIFISSNNHLQYFLNKSKEITLISLIRFFFLFCIITSITFSQKQQIQSETNGNEIKLTIDFENEPYKIEGENGNIIDFFKSIDESKPGSPILPSKTYFIAIPPESKANIKILEENISSFESVIPKSNPQLKLSADSVIIYQNTQISPSYYQNSIYPNSKYEIIGYTWIRDYYCLVLKINTHLYDWTKRKITEIKSLKLQIEFYDVKPYKINKTSEGAFDKNLENIILNFSFAKNFRSFQNKLRKKNLTSEWIDFNAEYLKLGTADDGIYRLYKGDLLNFNINVGNIDPTTFKIFLIGNEIPIFVSGENDGSFDDNDFIEFYGSINYAEANHRVVNQTNEPYSEYIDKYSDTTIYWLTWGGDKGLRPDTSNHLVGGIIDTLLYYTEIAHYEQDNFLDYSARNLVEWQNPEWLYNESWIWGNQGVGTVNRSFNVSNLVNDESAKAFFRTRSYASDLPGEQNAHNLGLGINSNPTVYDSGYINKYEQKILQADFSSNLLQDGQNTLKTYSYPVDNSSINLLQVDWYEIEYPRYIVLVNDSLKFKFNQSNLNSFQIVKIGNAQSNNHILYKISDYSRRCTNLLKISDNLFFADTIISGDEFYISTEEQIKSPKIYYKKQFQNLVDSTAQADYILITHPYFYQLSSEYLNFIPNNYQVTTKLINVLDIYDQFNYGFFSPEPIREFLYQANQNWAEPKPSFLFLVGEANYDYKNNRKIMDFVPNYVPSFGHPVSDNWFTMWDSLAFVPQMFIGRLAVNSEEEFIHYRDKHQKYLDDPYNIWNKTYFLLSGGFGESEKLIAKSINDFLIPNYIEPAPLGGYASQLYATENPQTNFGPFSQSYIDSVFDRGGIVISYLGHSGTKIWDNGIENVDELKNIYNKYPLISDFGCSTGKFAEPDIVSFSEAFTNGMDGDAIAYLGNSSLGFTSTSYTYPKLFFEQISILGNTNISSAHIAAKIALLENYGFGSTRTLFVLTNSLLGDPIISLKIPAKPNLNIEVPDIQLPSFLDDNLDSISINIRYRNLGRTDSSDFSILIEDYVESQLVLQKTINHQLPLNEQMIEMSIPIKNRPGKHTIRVSLDSENNIDEIYEDDNLVAIDFNVVSSSIRSIVADSVKIIDDGKILFLNSIKKPEVETLLVQLSTTPDFQQSSSFQIQFDTLISSLELPNLTVNKRYWYKTSLSSSPETVFERNSFIYNGAEQFNFSFYDSLSMSGFNFTNSEFSNGSIRLSNNNIPLEISSAGFEDGGIAKIELDGVDYPVNPFGCGFHIVVIDENLIQFEDYRWFNFWDVPNNYEAFYNYLNTISTDKLIAISIGASCGGYNVSQELKDKLKEFGSAYIDSVVWGSSWFILGKLGSAPGSVPEGFSTTGPVGYDTTFVRNQFSGSFSTSIISNSGNWKLMNFVSDSVANSSQIKIRPIIHDTSTDTLVELNFDNGFANIGQLNNYKNIPISFLVEINSDEFGNSPLFNSLSIDYDLVPELGTNYQVVSSTADTILIGEDIGLYFYVYNVGEVTADTFKVKVDVIDEDNSRNTVFETLVDSIQSGNRKYFSVNYNTSSGSGDKTFLIDIDSDQEVTELFEDNNFYSVPFYVKQDTSKPLLNIAFDGIDILDGDYISPNPEIIIGLSDFSLLPITDTSAVTLFLNDQQVYYAENQSTLSAQFNSENPKVVVTYTPDLPDGDYVLKVFGQNSLGNMVDSTGVEKHFIVSDELKLLNVYNYPNPTSGETYFTFKLTQIPDELNIKIYTVAGRLIKEISIPGSDLNFDFNKVYWDGRDEDGDNLANGVYLYKVVVTSGDNTEDVIQKLAIVR